MLINVTQEHIDKGFRKACTACPVALAILSRLKKGYYVRVGKHWTGFTRQGSDDHIPRGTPEVVTRFVSAFDAGDPVAPFEFELDIPERVLE